MANGSHALKLLAPEPLANPLTEIETTIGTVVANAVTTFCLSLQNYQHLGRLDPELREAGGNRVAQLVELWLAHGGSDEDFIDMARHQGRIRLRQYLDADFFRHNTIEQGDAGLDFFLRSIFEITDKVVREERALRMAGAH
jgi:hypothetical protein